MSQRLSHRIAVVAVGLALVVGGIGSTLSHAARSAGKSADTAQLEVVDLNESTLEQLMAIPGIGKVTAERIIAFRKEHGPFNRVEDLMKVKGIGEKSFQKLRAYLKVSKSK